METEIVIMLRFLERILAVAIGGLAIYLGYRLFSLVPESRDGEGRVTLAKDVSLVVSRVGPGVFFALFGAGAVGLSLHEGVDVTVRAAPTEEIGPAVDFHGAGLSAEMDDRADARMLLRREIAILNTLPELLDPDLPAQDRTHVEQAIPRIKLALMRPLWGEASAGWGTPEDFERWRREGRPGAPPDEIAEAVRYFDYPASAGSP